jgi:hypothetical protein
VKRLSLRHGLAPARAPLRSRVIALGAPCALALCFAPRTASAAPAKTPLPRVDWTAPVGCPTATELLSRVRALLSTGKAPAVDSALSVAAEASQVSTGEWSLTLTWRHDSEPESRRQVAAKSCDEVVDAAALLVALAIDPTLSPPESAAPVEQSSDERAPPSPPTGESADDLRADASRLRGAAGSGDAQSQATRRDVPSASVPLRLRAGVGMTIVTGWLPSAAPGLVLLGAAALGRWSVGLELGGFVPRDKAVEATSAGGEFWLARAAVTTGYAFDVGTLLVVAPTAGAALNVVYGRGTGALAAQGGYTTAAALVAGLRVRRVIAAGWTLSVGGDALFAGVRPSFSVGNGGGEVFRPDSVAFLAGLGLEVDFR